MFEIKKYLKLIKKLLIYQKDKMKVREKMGEIKEK